jgi:hypothetical protein
LLGDRVGKHVFTANTGSQTISRLVGTGNNMFVDSPVAASIATGGAPADIDADAGVLGVIEHGAGQSHLSFSDTTPLASSSRSGRRSRLVFPMPTALRLFRLVTGIETECRHVTGSRI